MSKTIGLVPAYGRDYTSKAKVKNDLDSNMDFRITDCTNPHNGRYANKEALVKDGYTQAKVRYGKLRKVAIIPL